MTTVEVNRGADRLIALHFTEEDGVTPYDLTGYTPVILDASAAISDKLDVALADAAGGVVNVTLDQTAEPVMPGKYVFRVQVNSGEVSRASPAVTLNVV